MSMSRFVRKTKLAALAAFAVAGGTMFGGCGLSDIKNNLVDGALAAVKGASTDFIGSFLVDFNEWIDPIPDAPLIDTP